MPDTQQVTLFALDCGATNWRLYRVEYQLKDHDPQILGSPQPAPLTSFVDRKLPAMITLNPAGDRIEAFGDVAQQQLDDENLRERIREHFKPCIGSHLEVAPLPHQKRYTHTQAMQFTRLLLQAVLNQIRQEKLRSAIFDDRVIFTFAYPVHWRYGHEGQVFKEFQALVSSCFPDGYSNLHFVSEPEGAILCLNARGLLRSDADDRATVIIDVGGSTTDIVAGRVDPQTGQLNLLGRHGGSFGGDLYDVEIAKYIADELKIPTSALADDPTAMISLRVSAQRLKESLSRQLINSTNMEHNPQRMVTLVMRDGSVFRRVITLDNSCFRRISARLEDQFTHILDQAMKVIALNESKIDQVVLVGGGAQLYTIIEQLRNRFGNHKVLLADTPDEIVAQGIGLEYGSYEKTSIPTTPTQDIEKEPGEGSKPKKTARSWKLITNENLPFHLPLGTLKIGRSKESDLVIDDPKVSRLHAELRIKDNSLEVVDLGSSNGTFLNSTRLAPHQSVTLKPGDEIIFGDTRFICQH